MRVLLSLGIALIFLFAGSPFGIGQSPMHVASYATEPEPESAETEEFSSQQRTRVRQRNPLASLRRFPARLARATNDPLFFTPSGRSSRESLQTLHAVFRI
ncbi:MAG TPA: hypothetical protein VNM15_09430 [Candidatus Binatia bacterium]|nr:hypothetical protein [Candidatus Binatia bacterium]